jgi:hypothetical protein
MVAMKKIVHHRGTEDTEKSEERIERREELRLIGSPFF